MSNLSDETDRVSEMRLLQSNRHPSVRDAIVKPLVTTLTEEGKGQTILGSLILPHIPMLVVSITEACSKCCFKNGKRQ